MAPDDDFERQLEAFRAEYRATLPQRLAGIDAAWDSLRTGAGGADALHALLRSLHSIAGSAATFGLPALGEAAASAEDWIEPYSRAGAAPPADAHGAFERLLAAVRAAAR